VSFEQCVNKFFQVDQLKGRNQYHCPHCKHLSDANKRVSIQTPSNIMIVHLKRFESTGRKINSTVRFPESFSIGPFTSEALDYQEQKKAMISQNKSVVEAEQNLKHLKPDQDLNQYSLFGVVVH